MLTRILLSLTLVGAAACADGTSDKADLPDDNQPDVGNPKPQDEPVNPPPVEGLVTGIGKNRAQCASDGPCSPACDADMVIDIHVPEGSCMTFNCGLGGFEGNPTGVQVGGCHP